ncbi:MAG: hypothetical protein C4540_03140 [Candidatus Omnitrophota bacterium]|nr:MAG: hypothetical protein C4540_03140 [Candidatus Omnitrophota bacterium]
MKLAHAAVLGMILLFSGGYQEANAKMIAVSGTELPIFEDSILVPEETRYSADLKVVTYAVSKPLEEVIAFYESFLKEQGFSCLGGRREGSFDASVKRGQSMFTLRIYTVQNRTIVQCIW